jgi:hypothetical protein
MPPQQGDGFHFVQPILRALFEYIITWYLRQPAVGSRVKGLSCWHYEPSVAGNGDSEQGAILHGKRMRLAVPIAHVKETQSCRL